MDQPTIVLKELTGNPPTRLDPLQSFFAPHVQVMATAWWLIWCATAAAVLAHLYREYRRRTHERHG